MSNITLYDIVLEIGTGKGDITRQLCKYSKKVISYEIDRNLYYFAKNKLVGIRNLELKIKNFLECKLPDHSYKCFSNIPFNFTADIVRKLLLEGNSPEEAYLFMQQEAAERFLGINQTTQISLLLKPLFSSKILYKFKRGDFTPKPSVDIVLVEFRKIVPQMLSYKDYQIYRDLIAFSFNQWEKDVKSIFKRIFTKKQIHKLSKELFFEPEDKPSALSFKQWLELFRFIKSHKNQVKVNTFKNYSSILNKKHKRRITLYRTRVLGI